MSDISQSTSRDTFTERVIGLYEDFFQGIELGKYQNKKMVQRIEFLKNLELNNLSQEELEKFSKAVLDARSIAVITEGDPNKFEIGERDKLGSKGYIEFWFLKRSNSEVNDALLEVIVHAWYKQNPDYEIEDFEDKYNNQVDKPVDFRLTNSEELIECKRISGKMEDRTIDRLRDTRKKFKSCESMFPGYTGHLIIDLGSHTEHLPTKYDEFVKEDFDSEQVDQVKKFLREEVAEDDCIDKVTICWLGSFKNKNPWYTFHKPMENSYSDEEVSEYEGWTIKTMSVRNNTAIDNIMIYSNIKDIEHAKADKDAVNGELLSWGPSKPTDEE